jgi:O-antigen biosynthesis protein
MNIDDRVAWRAAGAHGGALADAVALPGRTGPRYPPGTSYLTIGVISWDGMHQAATAIARAVAPGADDVVVVYSNSADQEETGAGRWVQTPQSLYFGAKFRVLLDTMTPGDALLLIQADAVCQDWTALSRRYREILDAQSDIGVWSPGIDNTPFTNAVVATGQDRDGLIPVLQTDAIVLGLRPEVVGRLSELKYETNNLGWGIDWVANAFCKTRGLRVVRDATVSIHHPKSRGYESGRAHAQMSEFLRQLTPEEGEAYGASERAISRNALQKARLGHVDLDAAGQGQSVLSAPSDILQHVSFLTVEAGRVLLAPFDTEAAITLRAGPAQGGMVRRADTQVLPRVLDFATDWPDGVTVRSMTGGVWACPGQSTFELAFAEAKLPLRIALTQSVDLDAAHGDLHLRLGAAIHRADVDLLIEWHDLVDPDARNEAWVKLDRQFTGAARTGNYQKIDIRIPRQASQTRRLQLTLCVWSQEAAPEGPAIVLCTRPYLISSAQAEAPTAPLVLISDATGNDPVARFEIPVPAGSDELRLSVGQQDFVLVPASVSAARIVRVGPSLEGWADRPGLFALVVNGRMIRQIWLGPEPQTITLGDALLADPKTVVELRDPTGNVVRARLGDERARSEPQPAINTPPTYTPLSATPPRPEPRSPVVARPRLTQTAEVPMDVPSAALSDLRLVEIQCPAGSVYVATTKPIDGADICVRVGDREFNFAACPDPVKAGLLPQLIAFDPAGGDGCTKSINGMGPWQVQGWDTLRVAFPSEMDKARITVPLTRPAVIVRGGVTQRFTCKLAVHRGQGNLIVRVADPNGKDISRQQVAFAPEFGGGDEPTHYQTVDLQLPATESLGLVHVELDYRGARALRETEPYVFFLADPRLTAAPMAEGWMGPSLGQRLECWPMAVWHRLDLPPEILSAGERVVLCRDRDDCLTIHEPQSLGVTLHQDWGHAVELNSSASVPVSLWVNGAPCHTLTLTKGMNVIRLAAQHLTGGHARMEIRDPSGMQVFWQDWCATARQLTALDHLQRESRSPYPSDLMPQTAHRYRALRAHCAAQSPSWMLAQLDVAIEALEAGHEALRLKPLKCPQVEAPDVSVIVPAHNKVKVTYAALCALLLAWNKASFEVIVVDDASTDQTAELETLVEGITVVRNETAQRFIRACNAGVAVARGTYVALLNNDTEPTIGWLDELISAFGRFDRVGLVGSRLLYPDGRQQEAGGIIWASGDPWNYGRLQNPWEPRFSYARQADYVSGAALLTTRAIWDKVGGLSSYLEPMYFEDTDLAFKVREAGLTTWYIPSSVVYHHEGVTSGTDTTSGFKRYQEVNRPKFKRRWSQAFAGFSKTGTEPDLEKDRGVLGRVLFVDYTTPTPDRDAGSYAALQEIRLVQSLGYKVTFLPENLAWMGSYTEELQKMGVEVIVAPFFRSVEEFLDLRAGEFDAFYITRYHVMNNVAPRIRKLAPDARIIMNGADLHYLRLLRKGIAEGDQQQIEGARTIRDQELVAMQTADLVLSYNETEHAVIAALSEGRVRVMTCPWVLDLPETVPPRTGRAGLSFLGSFQHHPNVEGVDWFLQQVMQPLGTTRPDIRLSIYGSRLPERYRALASATIDPVGYVEDVADAYDRHLVFVAPLLSGAGIKGKVLSALAHGIPCILSPVAAEGIGLRDGEDCLIARTPADWVAAVTRLHDDEALWSDISANARRLAQRQFSFPRARDHMRAAFEAVELFRVRE